MSPENMAEYAVGDAVVRLHEQQGLAAQAIRGVVVRPMQHVTHPLGVRCIGEHAVVLELVQGVVGAYR
eukprot:183259-Amphidinium_carterae.1